jgi:tRNA nucleotidyltransferase (CCA-adding enzyme)
MDVITTHVNADFDCLGAMVAAHRLYPNALMVFSGSQEKSMRDFFLKSTGYALDFTRLRDVDFAAVTRLILVDCRHTSRIGRFAELVGKPGVEVIIYDHHPESSDGIVPDGGVIRDCGSSTTILALMLEEKGIVPTPVEATVMMLGIYEDTGCLTFPSTTTDDYHAAAWLLEHGAVLNTVADFVTQELTAEQVALLNDLLDSLKTISVNGIDVSIASSAVDYYIGDIAALAHMIRDMENLQALFVVVDMGKRIYIVGRSRIPEVNVGEILRAFGGGGHASAASATARDLSLIQILHRLEEVLRRGVNPRRLARDLMSAPVKTIPAESTLAEARELLVRYNVGSMPVTRDDRVAGIISRRIVEKALYHDLGSLPVGDYMHTEFFRAGPETPLAEIREYIVGHNRRFVPVFEGETLVGAITRSDLLRYLHAGLHAEAEPAYDLESEHHRPRKRDLLPMVTKQLPPAVVSILRDLGAVGDNLEIPVYAVGGFVRDLLTGFRNVDVDVTVEGDGILFAETFAARFGCRVKSHRKFETAVIVFPDGFKIDVASTRLEFYETPGALPTVERSSLKMDLYRRDFTVNTLAMRLNGGEFGRLFDFFGGQRDIRERSIRVLHNLSFVEDPTRVFRAIRFEQKLGFRIAPHTENLIRNTVKLNLLERLGGRRLLTELMLIFRDNDPLAAVTRMGDLGLLVYIHPLIELDPEMGRVLGEAQKMVEWYRLLYLADPCEKWVVCFLALTGRLSPAEFRQACRRLSVNERYAISLAEGRERGGEALGTMRRAVERGNELRDSEVYRLVHGLPVEVLLYLMAAAVREPVRRWISRYFTHLKEVKPLLTGDDLRQMGIPPGPLYAKILDSLLVQRLDGRLATREDELRAVADFARTV